eukprot:TRINITY_DN1310_c0_g1_i1.p1 TRINITY_DN1310_c0_g1~~TRINITY_DN1310_c0_g1_i1.p1  ORF type:complete len:238 (+),score=54.59 TRINITY_DN1310_c0_g1_i1:45-758(+)
MGNHIGGALENVSDFANQFSFSCIATVVTLERYNRHTIGYTPSQSLLTAEGLEAITNAQSQETDDKVIEEQTAEFERRWNEQNPKSELPSESTANFLRRRAEKRASYHMCLHRAVAAASSEEVNAERAKGDDLVDHCATEHDQYVQDLIRHFAPDQVQGFERCIEPFSARLFRRSAPDGQQWQKTCQRELLQLTVAGMEAMLRSESWYNTHYERFSDFSRLWEFVSSNKGGVSQLRT